MADHRMLIGTELGDLVMLNRARTVDPAQCIRVLIENCVIHEGEIHSCISTLPAIDGFPPSRE
jgi:hypothetical protein